ncbi:MAG: thioredoxin family protein [Cytophagales bacterium]
MSFKLLISFVFFQVLFVYADQTKESPSKRFLGSLPSQTPSGKTLKIEHFKGNNLLICFWASYNQQSLNQLKSLKTLHEKFNRGGFEILAVSLDNNLSGWMQGIQQNDFSWMHHVSDLEGWKSKSIPISNANILPYFILLDENGTLIFEGADIETKELEAKTKQLFNQVFRVFPESTANEVWFTKEVKFELLTQNGKVIHKGIANALDLSELSPGIFWLLVGDERHKIEKMMKPEHVYFYPKRVQDIIQFSESTPYKLYNRRGVVVREGFGNTVNVENLVEGVYYLWMNGLVERILKK